MPQTMFSWQKVRACTQAYCLSTWARLALPTRKCSQTTFVFTFHQMHPRNPARISQVPTFCWWHSYLLQREITIKTHGIPVWCCHDFEDMVGWKRTLPNCRQEESHVLVACHLSDPSRHCHRDVPTCTFPYQLNHPTSILDSILTVHWHGMPILSWEKFQRRLVHWNVREMQWPETQGGNTTKQWSNQAYNTVQMCSGQVFLMPGKIVSFMPANVACICGQWLMHHHINLLHIITFKHCSPWNTHAVLTSPPHFSMCPHTHALASPSFCNQYGLRTAPNEPLAPSL